MKECVNLIYHSELELNLCFRNLVFFFLSMSSSSMLLRHTSDINIPVKQNFPAIQEVAKQSGFQLFPSSIQTSNNTKGGLEQQQSATNSAPIVDQVC